MVFKFIDQLFLVSLKLKYAGEFKNFDRRHVLPSLQPVIDITLEHFELYMQWYVRFFDQC